MAPRDGKTVVQLHNRQQASGNGIPREDLIGDKRRSFAKEIVSLRAATGMNQAQLAREAGLQHALISLAEAEKRAPSIETLVKIGNVAAEHGQSEKAEWFWRAAGVTGIPRYRHPRTGEKRKHIQPLRIDRLGSGVKDAIIAARASGESWAQVAAMASAAAGQQLSRTSVQRWYDLRVEQQSTGAALREIIELLKSILKAVQP